MEHLGTVRHFCDGLILIRLCDGLIFISWRPSSSHLSKPGAFGGSNPQSMTVLGTIYGVSNSELQMEGTPALHADRRDPYF